MKSQRVTTHPRNIATAVAASATIAAFLAGCSGGQDDPAAVVQEWISAVQDGDYEQACLMVAEDESTPLTEDSDDFGECTTAFEMLAQEGSDELSTMADDSTSTEQDGAEATVEFRESGSVVDLIRIDDAWYLTNVD